MAKSDKGDLYDETRRLSRVAESDYNTQVGKNENRGDVTWNRATENYDPAFKGYMDYASGGGLKPEDIDRMRAAWGNAGGAGGVSAPRLGTSHYQNLHSAYANAYRPDYGESDTGFRKLASESGGFDADQLKQIYGNIGKLGEIGQTGGITDEDKANINRKSILEQEETGGYSAQDRALIRAKTAASSPAYFGALKDNLERQRAATGNLANAGAVDYKLARQGAQQQGADRIAGEIGLGDSIRKGRESAGQFLSNQGMDLASLRTANELAGARSAGDLGLNTQMGITANQAQALRGLQESQTGLGQWGLGQAGGLDQFGLNQAGGLDNWDLSQAQMDLQAAAASASNARSSARDQAQFEQWVTEYGNQQKQYGIGGLTDLYGTNLGASQNYSGLTLDALNGKFNSQYNMLNLATQNRGTTAMENSKSIGGMVGGLLGTASGIDWSKVKKAFGGGTNTGTGTGTGEGYGGGGVGLGGVGGGYDPGQRFRDPNNPDLIDMSQYGGSGKIDPRGLPPGYTPYNPNNPPPGGYRNTAQLNNGYSFTGRSDPYRSTPGSAYGYTF